MIEFINEKDGTLYRTYTITSEEKQQGKKNYTFYFDDSQSTGLYYQKRLIFVSDKSSVDARIDSNEVFFFYDLSKGTELKDIKVYSITLKGEKINSIYSETYNNLYIYCLNIGCISDATGDFSISFTIDNQEYDIYSSFWGQQENLEILLQNQGVSLPYDIERAIYETNVHTLGTTPDWITLNKKYKELLLNSVDILYKKGSYSSLVKSLSWFEWGELAHLHEYWNRVQNQNLLHERDLTIDYNDTLRDMMSIFKKTTFISIAVPKDTLKKTNGYVLYEKDNEECLVPLLEDVVMKWGYEDIALKLTLLGNYYSTFFMPLHLDLLYTSLEDLALVALKNKCRVEGLHRSDIFNETSCGESLVVDTLTNIYYIGDCTCRGYGKVVNLSNMSCYETEKGLVLGQGALFALNLRVLKSNDNYINDYNKVVIKLNKGAKNINVEIPVQRENDGKISLIGDRESETGKIYIYIKDPGKYRLGINLFANCGNPLMTTFVVEVLEDDNRGFNIYHLKRKTDDEIKKLNDDFQYLAFAKNLYSEDKEPEKQVLEIPDKLYYPESTCFSVSGCFCTDSESNIKVLKDSVVVETGDINTIKKYLKDIPDSVVLEKVVKENDTMKGTMLYLVRTKHDVTNEYYIRKGNTTSDLNKWEGTGNKDRKIVWFFEHRFLPFIYKRELVQNPENYLSLDKKNAIFEYSPIQRYDNGTNNEWTLTNERTQEKYIIHGQLSPIVCFNNSEDEGDYGYLSVSLKNSLGTFVRRCFAKVVPPTND